MAKLQIQEIDMSVLPKEVKKELLDFYKYLVIKYRKKEPKQKSFLKKSFFESLKKHSFKLPEDYKFNREELHER